jgi:AcrR family transcriptional regulator
MATAYARKPRERILAASADLFYAHDAHSVGVDLVCATADVSKRTLYKHFATKEMLVAAALAEKSSWWSKEFAKIDSDGPLERILGVFQVMERNAGTASFHGCPMMNTSIELRDVAAPAKLVAKEFKRNLFTYFKEQAIALGASAPDSVAEQLVMLNDGCNAWIVMHGTFPQSTFTAARAIATQHE